MSNVQFSSTSVDVPIPALWDTLIQSITHPDLYLPFVTSSKILRRSGREIIRSVKTRFGEFIERITIDFKNLEVSFKLLNHPEFTGETTGKIVPPNQKGGLVLLTFIREWKPRKPGIDLVGRVPNLEETVRLTKQHAEGF